MSEGDVPSENPGTAAPQARRFLPLRRLLGRLGIRLMVLMGLALLPLALMTYVQSVATIRVAQSRAEAAILGDTLVAAAPLTENLTRARGAATGLAAALPVLDPGTEGCDAALSRFVAESGGIFSFVGFTQADGRMTCASNGRRADFSTSPRFRSLMADPKPTFSTIKAATMSGTTVLTLTQPVRSADDRLLGILSLSIPHAALQTKPEQQPVEGAPLALITVDGQGQILTSSTELDATAEHLPEGWTLPQAIDPHGIHEVRKSFVAEARDGTEIAYALVSILPGQVYLIGSWPVSRLSEEGFTLSNISAGMPPLLLPALMWAASLLVAWIAAETQVLRHVRALGAEMAGLAAGMRDLRPVRLRGAARELREMGQAFATMRESVLRNEAELENIIHQKQVLLREVHHRVKNNLQLIASILNMQVRSTRSPEARETMRNVQERVLALATIHRELYQTSGQADVLMSELLPEITGHHLKLASLPGRSFDLQLRIDDIRLTPDQAVPLALLITEGMAHVIRTAVADGAGRVPVALELLRQGDGSARLFLASGPSAPGEESLVPVGEGMGPDRFGTQLLSAFAAQIGATVQQKSTGGRPDGPAGGWQLEVVFAIRALSDAEEAMARAGLSRHPADG